MNETITLNQRQKAIINLLSDGKSYKRDAIAAVLDPHFAVSKATLARDIAHLVDHQVIKVSGSGPSTAYQILAVHPLLTPVDLNYYFSPQNEPNRQPCVFNANIYDKVPGVFNSQEISNLKEIARPFSTAVKHLSPTIVERELERFVIELSWKSSQIEGNTYTLLETETLIKQQLEASGKSKAEATMILNHKEAFNVILDHRADFKVLNLSDITELHQTLIAKLNIDSGLRQHAVGITGTTYRPPDNIWQIKEHLGQLIDLVNHTVYPLEKALIALSSIAYLQPFTDGNKRTARMLANAILLAYDYFPISYRSISIDEYKKALILFYESNNLYHLKRLFISQYNYALANYFL